MTFKEARELFAKSRKNAYGDVKLDRNTYLVQIDDKTFGVRLHDTYVVKITRHWIELDSGGWNTKTTSARINDYAPAQIGARRGGWFVFTVSDNLPCYCDDQGEWVSDAIMVKGEGGIGRDRRWTNLYSQPDGSEIAERGEHGKPIYEWHTCATCQGTGLRSGFDYGSGGYPYFDGIRVSPDGKRLMRSQPRKPKTWQPVITVSGWTGLPLAGGSR